jgi:hypothetical protein
MSEKKLWVKPQLVVVGRGRPEESVLAVCKGNGSQTSQASLYSLCHLNYLGSYCGTPCAGYSAAS